MSPVPTGKCSVLHRNLFHGHEAGRAKVAEKLVKMVSEPGVTCGVGAQDCPMAG